MKAQNLGCWLIAITVMSVASTVNAQCSGGGGRGAGSTGTTTTGATGTTSGSALVSALSGDSFAVSNPANVGAQRMYAQALSEQAWLRQTVYKQQLARRMRNEALKSDSDELLSTKKDRLFAQKSNNGMSNASSSAEKFASK